MDILGVGVPELIFILVIALMVLGPRRLPEVANRAGKIVRDFRGMYEGLLVEWQREITVAARLEELEEARQELIDTGEALTQTQKEMSAETQKELNQAQEELKQTQEDIAAELPIEQRTISPTPAFKQDSAKTVDVEQPNPNADISPDTITSELAQEEVDSTESISEINESGDITSSSPNTNNKEDTSVGTSPSIISKKPEEVLNE